jgi:ParB/RepB/Spo0J family partition protein
LTNVIDATDRITANAKANAKHGTEAGYRAGCRMICCTKPHADKAKADRAAAKKKRDAEASAASVSPTAAGDAAPIDLRPDSGGIPTAANVLGQLRDLPVDAVVPDVANVRRHLGDLDELAESIAKQGVLQALLVNDAGDGTYVLIAGHRRLAAAKQAGLITVPCVVRQLDEIERLEAQLVENIQRVDIDPLEEALGMSRLAALTGMGQAAIGKRLGRSQAHVSKRLQLLALPERARDALDRGDLTLDDAHALIKLKDHQARLLDVLERRKRERYRTVSELVRHELEQVDISLKCAAAIAGLPAGARYKEVEYYSSWNAAEKPIGTGIGQVPVTRAQHKGLKCLIAVIERNRDGKVTWCCDRPSSHPEFTPRAGDGGRGELSEKEKAERTESRRRNKELKIAQAGRLTHLRAIAQAATAVPDLDVVHAWWALLRNHEHRELLIAACDILRVEPKKEMYGSSDYVGAIKTAPMPAAVAALTLAAGEAEVRSIRFDSQLVKDLYRRLRAAGYQPCPDEEKLLRRAG